ncbi:MAG: hypothetical protein D4R77_08480 [Planctomycetaceae bacterium]|nr:MAG: hypothetical protein D4R77_08480 [Planctomycetaceae bacterium]
MKRKLQEHNVSNRCNGTISFTSVSSGTVPLGMCVPLFRYCSVYEKWIKSGSRFELTSEDRRSAIEWHWSPRGRENHGRIADDP